VSRLRHRVLLGAALILLCGGAFLRWVPLSLSEPMDVGRISRGEGLAFALDRLPSRVVAAVEGDDNGRQASPLELREDGRPLGPAHAMHEDIRRLGAGRFSHWGSALIFSSSDNSDPRTNGRAYSLTWPLRVPGGFSDAALALGVALLLMADLGAWVSSLAVLRAGFARSGRSIRDFVAAPWTIGHVCLFAGMAAIGLIAGFARSPWVLATQPVEWSHAANSMLGFSFIEGGTVLHKENWSAIQQVAFLSGADAAPDLYFRRATYAFAASLLTPILGVSWALVAVNVLSWLLAVCACHHFAKTLYGERAATWASALCIAGIGFSVHLLDLSAHLLSFALYMGGMALVAGTNVWRESRPLRIHLVIAIYLAFACLEYNTGIALTLAYAVVAIRRNRAMHVLLAVAIAVSAPLAWEAMVEAIIQYRHGAAMQSMANTEQLYLQEAIARWKAIFAQPLPDALGSAGRLLMQFLSFENPWVALLGALGLVWQGRSAAGRSRLLLMAPFVALPIASAFVFATRAAARGYLVYGISLVFFASCGACLSSVDDSRLRRGIGAALVAFSCAWSLAHLADMLGPVKAYMLGFDHAWHLFAPGGVRVLSLSADEVIPRVFGGQATLLEAGLGDRLPVTRVAGDRVAGYAMAASAIFLVLTVALMAAVLRLQWRMALLASVVLACIPWINSRFSAIHAEVFSFESAVVLDSSPLTYVIHVSSNARDAILRCLRNGEAPALFAASYTGRPPPSVVIGSTPVRIAPSPLRGIWELDAAELRSGLEVGNTRLAVTFPGGTSIVLAGWQRRGLDGRELITAGVPPATAPHIELRLLRDWSSATPTLVAY
jgi:hypothetical protein